MAGRHVTLIYDIPERLKFPNPSGRLKRLGVRINLSCWIIPENHIPHDLLDTFTAKGVSWSIIRFDENEASKIRDLARYNLGVELGRIKKSIAQAIDRANEVLANGEWSEKKQDRFDKQSKLVLRRAKKALKSAEEAAYLFDLNADLEEGREIVANAISAAVDLYVHKNVAAAPGQRPGLFNPVAPELAAALVVVDESGVAS